MDIKNGYRTVKRKPGAPEDACNQHQQKQGKKLYKMTNIAFPLKG